MSLAGKTIPAMIPMGERLKCLCSCLRSDWPLLHNLNIFSLTTTSTPPTLFVQLFTVSDSAPPMFSIFSVLVTSLLRTKKASVPISSREDLAWKFFRPPPRERVAAGSNRLARLKRLCADATGLSCHFDLGPSFELCVHARRDYTSRHRAHFPATRTVFYPHSLPGTITRFSVVNTTDR